MKNDGLNLTVRPETIALFGSAGDLTDARVLVRTMADPGLAASALRSELRQMDSRMLVTTHTMRETFAEETSQPRFQSAMFGGFAALSLLLAMVGIYGVVAFAVASRTKEIGIRMAIGADANRVVLLMVRDIAAPVALGILAGLAGSVAASRYLGTLLYDIKPTDPLTYGGVVALMAVAALGASLAPARRASRVDPVNVLRAE